MNRVVVFAFVAMVASAAFGASARAQLLRHCVRQDALCWRCIDVVPPLHFPCPDRLSCSPPGICVEQDLISNCYASQLRCCAASDPDCVLPDCAGAASACGDVDGDGTVDHCTSLTECPGAMASTLFDGGVPALLDAGEPRSDAGTIDAAAEHDAASAGPDASAERDASTALDAGAGTAMDGSASPVTPPESFGFEGGGGCSCSSAPGSRRLGAPVAPVLVGVLLLGARAAHTRRRRRANLTAGE